MVFPRCVGTVVNAECELLLLRHAFDAWGANRVELYTEVLNLRSQAAIAKLGAVKEGVPRAHMVVRDGRVRDSALFSITRPEWATVGKQLESRIQTSQAPA